MDAFLAILKNLNVDKSFFVQLVLVCVVFVLAKFVLFEKLKAVLLEREANLQNDRAASPLQIPQKQAIMSKKTFARRTNLSRH